MPLIINKNQGIFINLFIIPVNTEVKLNTFMDQFLKIILKVDVQFVSNRFVFDFKSLSSVNLVITESSFAQVTFIHDCVSDFKLRF